MKPPIPDLDAFERLAEAASPRPWEAIPALSGEWWVELGAGGDTSDALDEPTAAFIAACRTQVPALITYARELREGLGKISPHTLAMGMLYEGGHEKYRRALHPWHWYGDDGQVQCCGRDFLAEARALVGEP